MVKETLRLRPVIDAAERTLTVPRTVAGWELPAGVKVYPAIALVHLREDLYPRAHEFRPERFLEDGAESYSWLPFGGGIRRCIGAALAQAEMAEVLRVVVPQSSFGRCASRPDPVVLRGITLAPKHGVQVQVLKRLAQPAPVADPGGGAVDGSRQRVALRSSLVGSAGLLERSIKFASVSDRGVSGVSYARGGGCRRERSSTRTPAGAGPTVVLVARADDGWSAVAARGGETCDRTTGACCRRCRSEATAKRCGRRQISRWGESRGWWGSCMEQLDLREVTLGMSDWGGGLLLVGERVGGADREARDLLVRGVRERAAERGGAAVAVHRAGAGRDGGGGGAVSVRLACGGCR